MTNWWTNLRGATESRKGLPILKMSRDDLTEWAKLFGGYSGEATLGWNDKTDNDTWGKKFINWSLNNTSNMSKYWKDGKWDWNPDLTTTQTQTPTQTPTTLLTPTWNSNPYNFSANDIRNYGSVENLYNLYASAASNNDFGNGYLAYLHDRYGSTWGNKLDRSSFENILKTNEGMSGGIKGRDFKQGFNSYLTWLADRNAAHANLLNTPKSPKKNWITSIAEAFQKLNYKTGGKFMNYYQEGGAVQDPQLQIIALVLAASQGDQQAQLTIQLIQSAAENGDQKAVLIMQVIQQVMQLMQGEQAQAAKFGAKLAYIKLLKGECPEGSHLEYFKAGGQICKRCAKDAIKKDCKGSKIKKACGGATAGMNLIKAELGSSLLKDKKLSDRQLKDPTGKIVTYKDRATRDSIAANRYNDLEVLNTMPGKYITRKDKSVVWAPDRSKAPYKKSSPKK